MIVFRVRLSFVRREFLLACHTRFLYLFGTSKDHMLFHNFFSKSGCVSSLDPASNSFRNLYPNLQLYCPFSEKGQNKESSFWLQASGIFITSSASEGIRIPSNISAFHYPVFSSIRQSTMASSMDSMIGEVTKVGCLMGSQ